MPRTAQKRKSPAAKSAAIPAAPSLVESYTAMNRLAMDGLAMWIDASMVIWLRGMRIAGGGRIANREATRMVAEKLDANWQLGLDMVLNPATTPDEAARRSIDHYAPRVRANRRRLSR